MLSLSCKEINLLYKSFYYTLSENIRTIDSNYHFVGKSIGLYFSRDCISLHRLMTKIVLSQQLALLHWCWQRKPFQRHDYWPHQPLVVIMGWSNKKHKIIHKYGLMCRKVYLRLWGGKVSNIVNLFFICLQLLE